MPKKVTDWDLAAEDAITYLHEGKRAFPPKRMLAFIDDLVIKGTAPQSEMLSHGSEDFIVTTLSNVTTAVHGGGAVPKEGGWYRTESSPPVYIVSAEFAGAWKRKRPHKFK